MRRLVLLLLLPLALACESDTVVSDDVTQPDTSSTSEVAPPVDSTVVTERGLGAVQLGMTEDEAIAAGLSSDGVSASEDCRYFTQDGRDGVAFMSFEGRIARVDVLNDSKVQTSEGVGVGSSEADIERAYPDRVEQQLHPYVSEGHYLVIDGEAADRKLIFETDGSVVTSFRSGLMPEVEWIEGCS